MCGKKGGLSRIYNGFILDLARLFGGPYMYDPVRLADLVSV